MKRAWFKAGSYGNNNGLVIDNSGSSLALSLLSLSLSKYYTHIEHPPTPPNEFVGWIQTSWFFTVLAFCLFLKYAEHV